MNYLNISGTNLYSDINIFLPTEDWDNEEYTGSLADTKVFTPSAHVVDQSVSTTVGVGTDGNVQPGDLDPSSQPPLASSAPVPPPTQSHVSQVTFYLI